MSAQPQRPGTTDPRFSNRDGDTSPMRAVPNSGPRVDQTNLYRADNRPLWRIIADRFQNRRTRSMSSNSKRPATSKVTFGDLSFTLKAAVIAAFASVFSVFIWIPAVLNDFTDKMEKSGAKAKFDYYGFDLSFMPGVPDGFFGRWYMIVLYVIATAVVVSWWNKRNQSRTTPTNH